ncbi:MAG: HPr family phosphocarrier protein [Candidatus Brocadiia bacterium]
MEKNVTIVNKLGIHVRPAAQMAELANKFKANIIITKNNYAVNAKSIMELLTLAAGQGTVLTLKADGDDAGQALESLEKLIGNKFNED